MPNPFRNCILLTTLGLCFALEAAARAETEAPSAAAVDSQPRAPRAASTAAQRQQLRQKIGLLHNTGHYHEAESLGRKLCEICERDLGAADPQTFSAMANLAESQRLLGHYADADRTYQALLQHAPSDADIDYLKFADVYCSLAQLHCDRGLYADAEHVLGNLCPRLEKEHPGAPQTLHARNCLSIALRYQGRHAEALQMLRAIQDAMTGSRPDPVLSAAVLNNLGDLYQSMRKEDEAASAYLRSQQLVERFLGPKHPLVALTLHNRAALEFQRKNHAAAKELELSACALLKERVGTAHPQYALYLNKLAEIHLGLADLPAAREANRISADILQKTVGDNHPLTAVNKRVKGEILTAEGRLAEAEAALSDAMKTFEHIAPHSEYARTVRRSLCAVYQAAGKLREAQTLEREIAAHDLPAQ